MHRIRSAAFPLLTALVLVLALVSLAGLNGQAQSPAGQPPSQVRQGYSIFRETMVELAWPAVKAAADAGALVLLPVAVIEEHGPHMGLGIDAYGAHRACVVIKKALEDRHVAAIVAPTMYWGIMQSNQSGAYPGSFTVRPSTMKALLLDILADLKAWGFRRIYVFNGHGDRLHLKTLDEALAEARDTYGLDFYNHRMAADSAKEPDTSALNPKDLYRPDFHAGASETAMVAAYFPEEVDLVLAKTLKPEASFHPLGYVGNPADYARINVVDVEKLELAYYADCMARWMKSPLPAQPADKAEKKGPNR